MTRLVLCILLISSCFTLNAKEVIELNDERWTFDDKSVSVLKENKQNVMKITSGFAMLNDLEFENGTIEFEARLPKDRAFAYLYFRGQSRQDVETIYLRTHKSKAPDAIQYSPVFQGRSSWQIYHGENGTAAATFPAEAWFPVKVKVEGMHLRVWVNDMEQTVLDIKPLGHKAKSGYIAFRGFIPRTSDAEYSAAFRNLRITKSDNMKITEVESPALKDSQITNWRVSPAFASEPGPIHEVPETLKNKDWDTPAMRHDGVFEFLRSRTIPEGTRHWSVVAEVNLKSETQQICQIHFGFSDELTLSVNGQAILYQDASYRFGKNRQQGVLHQDQVVAFVNLNEGNNLLRAIVSDRFGGWGLSARMNNCNGVTAL